MTAKSSDIDAYLAALGDDQRGALEALRGLIRAEVPEAVECISYRLPAFRLHGKLLLAFGAAAKHCALYPMGASTVDTFKDALAGFDTSKGAIRFQPGKPLPGELVRAIVRARIAENE